MSARSDREDYLSLVLHELRNPLVGIDAAARVLTRELGPHPASTRASAIASEARHLLALLESVADAEAAAAGRLRSHVRRVDLAALVRDTIAGMHIEGHPVTVAGVEAALMVQADSGRIRQVLSNLLANAAQYSPAGTPIDVSVNADPRRATARVEVRDRGPGIAAPERRRLFRKFTRLTTADGTRGSGLGLYICKAIVEDHGGAITYSRADVGSVFSFDLPLKKKRTAAKR
ncbi:MAG TPA: HAMP domain-containing sensor histidine kinase [Candidatus Limnocylindria bacterium]